MIGHKTNMNITKVDKYKNTEQRFYDSVQTDMNITKIDKYKQTDHYRTQNRH